MHSGHRSRPAAEAARLYAEAHHPGSDVHERGERAAGRARRTPLRRSGAAKRHVAAIESDRGGFAPRGFTVHADSAVLRKVQRWSALFDPLWATGSSGIRRGGYLAADRRRSAGVRTRCGNHRYFDYHHSDHDTIDKVHPLNSPWERSWRHCSATSSRRKDYSGPVARPGRPRTRRETHSAPADQDPRAHD